MFGFDDVTFALQIDFFMPFQYNRVSARAASRDKCVFVFEGNLTRGGFK